MVRRIFSREFKVKSRGSSRSKSADFSNVASRCAKEAEARARARWNDPGRIRVMTKPSSYG